MCRLLKNFFLQSVNGTFCPICRINFLYVEGGAKKITQKFLLLNWLAFIAEISTGFQYFIYEILVKLPHYTSRCCIYNQRYDTFCCKQFFGFWVLKYKTYKQKCVKLPNLAFPEKTVCNQNYHISGSRYSFETCNTSN